LRSHGISARAAVCSSASPAPSAHRAKAVWHLQVRYPVDILGRACSGGVITIESMTRYFTLILLVLVAGCSSYSHVLRSREIVLSPEHPWDAFINASIVSIADDGTTIIRTTDSATVKQLQAVPGGFFAPHPYQTNDLRSVYGFHGLQLISASAEKHEAHLLRLWCE
jgi:hypothetical protein